MSSVSISVVPYSQFSGSEAAYFAYLRVCENAFKVANSFSGRIDGVVDGVSVVGCSVSRGCQGQICGWLHGKHECARRVRTVDGGIEVCRAEDRSNEPGSVGTERSVPVCVSDASDVCGRPVQCEGVLPSVGQEDVVEVTVGARVVNGENLGTQVRGKNYEKNKAKRERAKEFKASVRGLREVCPSLTGSVRTVDTRTAEEIEAVKTLAARRVVENKVAKRMAELKLISLNNKDKTAAVLRLEAARMEQRINEAKAKSQASFKECDTSLKSLGSTGSAGEFALKQEVKRGRDNEIRLKYAQLQNDYMIKHVPEHVRQVILDMPEPVFEHDAEVFGECPEDYDDEQRMAYDIEMNSRAAGVIY